MTIHVHTSCQSNTLKILKLRLKSSSPFISRHIALFLKNRINASRYWRVKYRIGIPFSDRHNGDLSLLSKGEVMRGISTLGYGLSRLNLIHHYSGRLIPGCIQGENTVVVMGTRVSLFIHEERNKAFIYDLSVADRGRG